MSASSTMTTLNAGSMPASPEADGRPSTADTPSTSAKVLHVYEPDLSELLCRMSKMETSIGRHFGDDNSNGGRHLGRGFANGASRDQKSGVVLNVSDLARSEFAEEPAGKGSARYTRHGADEGPIRRGRQPRKGLRYIHYRVRKSIMSTEIESTQRFKQAPEGSFLKKSAQRWLGTNFSAGLNFYVCRLNNTIKKLPSDPDME
jgi:hypothetical protein